MYFQNISNHLVCSTVQIRTTKTNGEQVKGTGFFCEIDETEEGSTVVLITNKHVIENGEYGDIEFPILKDGEEEFETLELNDFNSKWILHPDSNIDLCALSIGEYIDETAYNKEGITLGFRALSLEFFPNQKALEGFGAIEDVIMIGYPKGIMDDYNLKPIVRKGITATSINIDYENKPEFLIDIACFEGSSGSPVFIYNQGMWIGENGKPQIGFRIFFIGVLCGGYDMPENPDIPLNLGVVIKANLILDFKDLVLFDKKK